MQSADEASPSPAFTHCLLSWFFPFSKKWTVKKWRPSASKIRCRETLTLLSSYSISRNRFWPNKNLCDNCFGAMIIKEVLYRVWFLSEMKQMTKTFKNSWWKQLVHLLRQLNQRWCGEDKEELGASTPKPLGSYLQAGCLPACLNPGLPWAQFSLPPHITVQLSGLVTAWDWPPLCPLLSECLFICLLPAWLQVPASKWLHHCANCIMSLKNVCIYI